jgi:hypothetical protein
MLILLLLLYLTSVDDMTEILLKVVLNTITLTLTSVDEISNN